MGDAAGVGRRDVLNSGAVRAWLPLLASLTLTATPLRAEDGEWALSFGPGLRVLTETVDDGAGGELGGTRFSPGALVRVRRGVGDFFQLGASLDLGAALPHDPSALAPIAAAFAEAHYFIDIVTWVPFVTFGVGALVRGEVPGDGLRADLALALGGGLEYRPERAFALGLTGRYEALVTDLDRSDAFSFHLVYTLFVD